MRASQFLSELTVDTGIKQALKQKGYKELGHGQDQLVFLEPGSGMILKIFGTNRSQNGSAGSNGLTFPQQTFKAFADYCAKRPDNQFLPYFSGWETFEFGGQRYLQIRCERLFPGTKYRSIFGLLEEMSSEAALHKNGAKIFLKDKMEDDDDWGENEYERMGQLITMLGGEEQYYLLWKTLSELGDIADRGGFHVDLHDENFMLGSDGHIVISDPFFSGWGKRDR